MKVWYCFKKKRQLVKGEVDCDLAAAHKKCGWFELHPAGSRVVTAEALVIERDKDTRGWPESVLHQISRMTDVTRIVAGLFLDDLADALARSKEWAVRFCTTHRACESDVVRSVCVVAAEAAGIDRKMFEPCTLVDALIVPKTDGEWPDWARQIDSFAREWDDDHDRYVVRQLSTAEFLDTIYEAAKETP